MANYRLFVDFDEGRQVVYDVADDIREISAFAELNTLPGLFESAHLDSSRASVVWNDRIDLPSDTIREYGEKKFPWPESVGAPILKAYGPPDFRSQRSPRGSSTRTRS